MKSKRVYKERKNKTKRRTRVEVDSFGKVKIPSDHFWGSNTERSLVHFSIGTDVMPLEFIYSYVLFKKCAVKAAYKLKLINRQKTNIIVKVCDEILDGRYNTEFPLHIWQTGSGTQTNMNINEVIANIANKKLTGKLGTKTPVHPNNDVNVSQSSNDSFISVIHIFVAMAVNKKLLPSLQFMIDALKKKQNDFKDIIKLGRTHLQDAVPLSVGQEFSGYVSLLQDSYNQIKFALKNIYKIAAGGTAVGTGLNSHPKFDKMITNELISETKLPFVPAPNKFAELSSHNAILEMSNAFKVLATNIMKIGNDIRWMASGPRAGFNELILPQNEPGSSIMPGKVNPTQIEASSMVSIQVLANNLAITFANSQGSFELNTYNPLMLYNIAQSIQLLTDVCINLTKYCLVGIKVNREKVKENVENALTLATALNPKIGYDNAAKLAEFAYKKNLSLKEANEELQLVPKDEMVSLLNPKSMI